jgi:hypothetical protein
LPEPIIDTESGFESVDMIADVNDEMYQTTAITEKCKKRAMFKSVLLRPLLRPFISPKKHATDYIITRAPVSPTKKNAHYITPQISNNLQ